MRICVIGGSSVEDRLANQAESVGRCIAERGHELVCGGLGGVMEAAARGASAEGGRTIGILPGPAVDSANQYIDIPIATGMGNARNAMVVLNGEAAIAIDGRWGTLSEISFALDRDLPIAGLETHDIDAVTVVDSPEHAVEYVESAVRS